MTSPFLFSTLCNRLGTEDINCCSFASRIFARSECIQDLSCSTAHVHRVSFMLHHTFSIGDRSGLQASLAHALCLQSHAESLVHNEAWHGRGVPGKSCRLDGSICISKIPTSPVVPSRLCRSPVPWALMHPHTIAEAGNGLDGLFHLWHVESDVRFFQKQAEMWTRLTREHVSTVLRSVSDELGGVSAQN